MKNKFKKLLAFAIFAIMAMAMAVTASATSGTYTVTLKGKTEGESTNNTYEVYKIATFDVSTLDNKVVYTNIEVQAPYKNAFKPDEVTGKDAEELATLSSTLAGITNDSKETVKTGVFTTTETGYYLFKEVEHNSEDAFLATKYILVAVDGYNSKGQPAENKDVTLKTSMAGITKKIVVENPVLSGVDGAKAGDRVDGSVAAIGDTVTYEIKAQIPEYPSYATGLEYVITDVMSRGLTYTGVDSIIIDSNDKKNDFTIKVENLGDPNDPSGQQVTITAKNDAVLTGNPGKTIVVTLKATLNDKANVGEKGNPNSVNLKYTNNWDKKTTYETSKDTVITYTGKLKIKKVDSEDSSVALPGAEFAIYGPRSEKAGTAPNGVDPTYTVTNDTTSTTYYYYGKIVTGQDGFAEFKGLDAGTYYAKETKAPEGYSLATEIVPIQLTITAEKCEIENANGPKVAESNKETSFDEANSKTVTDYQVTWKHKKNDAEDGADFATITNKKGAKLPGTGGMGTTIFTIGGIVLVALAALMFVVYMRKQKKQA